MANAIISSAQLHQISLELMLIRGESNLKKNFSALINNIHEFFNHEIPLEISSTIATICSRSQGVSGRKSPMGELALSTKSTVGSLFFSSVSWKH